MPLERRTVTFKDASYTRLFGQTVEQQKEVSLLTDSVIGGNYFYGGIIDTGPTVISYFGQGPNHDIFKLMIRQITGSDNYIDTCQIFIDPETQKINTVAFIAPPEKIRGIKISTLARAISTMLFEKKVKIGWRGEENDVRDMIPRYMYLPHNDLLKKYLHHDS